MKFEGNGTAWKLEHEGRTILECSECAPLLYVGCGQRSEEHTSELQSQR